MSQVTQFTPTGENTRLLRDAFGRFATGVTVITAQAPAGPVAIVANSFSSLSLTPALLLWCADQGAGRFEHFAQAEHFVVHVLSTDQSQLCLDVAADAYCLRNRSLPVNDQGLALLDGALARFECKRHASYPGGDHVIFVGEILEAQFQDAGKALTFFKGRLGTLAPAPVDPTLEKIP